ncbi:hypothetical protein ACSQ67_018676 [Phaseolus vulgaris]
MAFCINSSLEHSSVYSRSCCSTIDTNSCYEQCVLIGYRWQLRMLPTILGCFVFYSVLMAIDTVPFGDLKNVFFFVLKVFFTLLAKIFKPILSGIGSLLNPYFENKVHFSR